MKEDKIEVDYITIPMQEYKELLMIKGKYVELKESHRPLIVYDGYNEKGTTILPHRDIQTTDPLLVPPYKITCNKGD